MVSNLLESSVTAFVIVAEIDSSASDSLMAVVIIDSVVVSSLVIDSINASACLEILDGRVDALINNAGIGSFDKLDDITLAQFQSIFNTNVFGLALLTKELIPSMKSCKSGTIINIGSSASVKGFSHGSVYSASKFAVRSLTQCWQAELRPFNIRVCQLNPSEVTTAFHNEARLERTDEDNKLSAHEIAHSIVSVLEMDDKGFITELNVWATNPF